MVESGGVYYRTEVQKIPFLARLCPSLYFYFKLILIVLRSSSMARKGMYDGERWMMSSLEVVKSLETVGVMLDIRGLDNLKKTEGPVVIIGNHMSMMETVVLPWIVRPFRKVTYVIKESLLTYPVFHHIMKSRNPIAVTRTNPRQDLKTVMSEGVERIKNDISVIVFPQTTRAYRFDPEQMSSIGVKLAKKADVPIIPLALKTDCWQNGRKLKDFGRIIPGRTAYFSFGKPIKISGKGDVEQQLVNDFIAEELNKWTNDE
ncbi:lysophospholipid acyltransferase family protein [Desulforhopalus singaporensis]|uniref:1-acyl-sn-glycerol-3-phosphate acyltransferase n=1 Tax=Desulforhopalus singaporensis TaxID=91360 RepID=A0A1H0SEV9_9BACT|nr:lysophospholipid acyltransferase family protein [Desulforhopalus singaporensis]SDP40264.1 1-acyl-sn-glycerol-3-phosphate acyltransferase [Desulforhopalus singaporensis]